ncbi:hypothetical protein L3Q82_020869, partial [Scortum barcoo]
QDQGGHSGLQEVQEDRAHSSPHPRGSSRACVNNIFKFLGIHITSDLTWCMNTAHLYGSCTAQDQKDLARVVKTAQGIVGSPLPDLDSIYAGQMQKKAHDILLPPTLPTREMDCLYCTASIWKT